MFKKRKNNKINQEDEAPILKKKNNLQNKIEKVVPNKIIKKLNIQPEQNLSFYQKFLTKFSGQNTKLNLDQNSSKYPLLIFQDKEIPNHFDFPILTLDDLIVQIKQQNINSKLQEYLEKENQRDEEKVLNNSIAFEDFRLKTFEEMKLNIQKFQIYKLQDESQLIIDHNSIRWIQKHGIKKQYTISEKIGVKNDFKQNPFTEKENEFYRIISSYFDFIFLDPDELNRESFTRLSVYHILNHFSNIKDDQQGYTKCKVLIICCLKAQACDIIDEMCTFYTNGKSNRILNADKFEEEFGDQSKQMDDNFKLGISFNENMVKLYDNFQNSDIIIASPLALKLHLEQQKHLAFLSSVEIVIFDDASKAYQQNWQHIEELFQNLNQMPKHQDISTDFNLIKPYFFENKQKFYRQTIIYSENNFPELNKLKQEYLFNYKGIIQIKPFYQNQIQNDACVEYMKLDLLNFSEDLDKRFEFFINKIWLKILDDQKINQTVIFTNNYIEFVKLRNYFKKTNAFVTFISEYTKKNKVQSKISSIMKHETPFLLFNERAYYFNVCQLKKMKNIIFYSPPKNLYIFKELINSMHSQNNQGPNLQNRIVCLFSQFDQIYIERMVGTKQSQEFFKTYNRSTTFII